MESNFDAKEIISDVESWLSMVEAKTLQIKSALITLREYVKDVEKDDKQQSENSSPRT